MSSELCGWCIRAACNSAIHLPIIVTNAPSEWDPRHATAEELLQVAGWKADDGAYVNLPAGHPAIRWLQHRAAQGRQVELDNNRYKPVAIVTIDGVPTCEAHAMTAMQQRRAPHERTSWQRPSW